MMLTNKIRAVAVAGLIGLLGGCAREEIKDVRPKETEKKTPLKTLECVRDGKRETFTVEQTYLDDLTRRGVPVETALKYDARFHDNFRFYGPYGGRNATEGIKMLYERNIDPDIVNKYVRWFGVEDVIALYQGNVMPEAVEAYRGFGADAKDMVWLRKKGVTPEAAKEYHERFRNANTTTMGNLHDAGISPAKAKEFHRTLNEEDVIVLTKAGISTEQANAYAQVNTTCNADINGDEILYLVQNKISPEAVEKRAKELLLDKIIRSK